MSHRKDGGDRTGGPGGDGDSSRAVPHPLLVPLAVRCTLGPQDVQTKSLFRLKPLTPPTDAHDCLAAFLPFDVVRHSRSWLAVGVT